MAGAHNDTDSRCLGRYVLGSVCLFVWSVYLCVCVCVLVKEVLGEGCVLSSVSQLLVCIFLKLLTVFF